MLGHCEWSGRCWGTVSGHGDVGAPRVAGEMLGHCEWSGRCRGTVSGQGDVGAL